MTETIGTLRFGVFSFSPVAVTVARAPATGTVARDEAWRIPRNLEARDVHVVLVRAARVGVVALVAVLREHSSAVETVLCEGDS